MQKECRRICSDLHTSKRPVVAAFDGSKITGGPWTNFKSCFSTSSG